MFLIKQFNSFYKRIKHWMELSLNDSSQKRSETGEGNLFAHKSGRSAFLVHFLRVKHFIVKDRQKITFSNVFFLKSLESSAGLRILFTKKCPENNFVSSKCCNSCFIYSSRRNPESRFSIDSCF